VVEANIKIEKLSLCGINSSETLNDSIIKKRLRERERYKKQTPLEREQRRKAQSIKSKATEQIQRRRENRRVANQDNSQVQRRRENRRVANQDNSQVQRRRENRRVANQDNSQVQRRRENQRVANQDNSQVQRRRENRKVANLDEMQAQKQRQSHRVLSLSSQRLAKKRERDVIFALNKYRQKQFTKRFARKNFNPSSSIHASQRILSNISIRRQQLFIRNNHATISEKLSRAYCRLTNTANNAQVRIHITKIMAKVKICKKYVFEELRKNVRRIETFYAASSDKLFDSMRSNPVSWFCKSVYHSVEFGNG
jgi:hypothetical protein